MSDWTARNVGPYRDITDAAYTKWLEKFPNSESPITYQAIAFGVFATLAIRGEAEESRRRDASRLSDFGADAQTAEERRILSERWEREHPGVDSSASRLRVEGKDQ